MLELQLREQPKKVKKPPEQPYLHQVEYIKQKQQQAQAKKPSKVTLWFKKTKDVFSKCYKFVMRPGTLEILVLIVAVLVIVFNIVAAARPYTQWMGCTKDSIEFCGDFGWLGVTQQDYDPRGELVKREKRWSSSSTLVTMSIVIIAFGVTFVYEALRISQISFHIVLCLLN